MTGKCRICGCGIDDQDIINAGMDELCQRCANKESPNK